MQYSSKPALKIRQDIDLLGGLLWHVDVDPDRVSRMNCEKIKCERRLGHSLFPNRVAESCCGGRIRSISLLHRSIAVGIDCHTLFVPGFTRFLRARNSRACRARVVSHKLSTEIW